MLSLGRRADRIKGVLDEPSRVRGTVSPPRVAGAAGRMAAQQGLRPTGGGGCDAFRLEPDLEPEFGRRCRHAIGSAITVWRTACAPLWCIFF